MEGSRTQAEREVTKDEFKRVYFEHLGDGWTPEYWDQFYAPEKEGERYFVKLPTTPKEDRMFIVSGLGATRMVFLTNEAEESFFTAPDGND